MKNHVFRPLFLVVAFVGLLLVARLFVVPKDFGAWERGYMYGFHRKSNENEWKAWPVSYKFDPTYCKDCHGEQFETITTSAHAIIPCEDCHGPALKHPEEPPKLTVDRSRAQCLRCHVVLKYPTSGRSKIRGIDAETHNPDVECAICHNPHKPALESMK